MIRIGCCDDSKECLNQIENSLRNWNSSTSYVLETFEDGDSLIKAHHVSPFDILLMDVLMPLLNGIDAAKEIRNKDKNVKIVFLTSSIEYAYDSYSVRASNYLLKPVDSEKLYACLNELCAEIQKSVKTIPVTSSGVTYRILLSEIETLEAQNKRVLFTLKTGRTILSSEPLYTFEQILLKEKEFYKCHRSYIINLYLIDSYSSKNIMMRSGQIIPLSRTLHKEFESSYFSALFQKAGETK